MSKYAPVTLVITIPIGEGSPDPYFHVEGDSGFEDVLRSNPEFLALVNSLPKPPLALVKT